MGNNSSFRPTAVADTIVNFQADLPKFIVQSKIGNGKLMKTYLMRCEGNSVVVKVYLSLPDEDLRIFATRLTYVWYILSPSKYPFLLPTQLWMKSPTRTSRLSSTPVYLIRQYLYANLLDRLSTRPFLSEIEKLWILFQLFKALEVCHSLDVVHGDIKPENVLCTTWNWTVLTDFALFKPVQIPDDDPSDFQYYFDTMNRPRCSIAPERFYGKKLGKTTSTPNVLQKSSGSNSGGSGSSGLTESGLLSDSIFGDLASTSSTAAGLHRNGSSAGTAPGAPQLTPAMDVFSLGCTMAEVVLDGEPLLDLPAMLKYVSSSNNSATSTANNSSSANNNNGNAALSSPSPAQSSTHAAKSSVQRAENRVNSPLPASYDRGGVGIDRLDQPNSPAKSLLDRIGDVRVRQVVAHMTQKDPRGRLSVADYRRVLEGRRCLEDSSDTSTRHTREAAPFPAYFGDLLYPLFLKLHWEGVGPDERIAIICRQYGDLMQSMTGDEDKAGSSFFSAESVAAAVSVEALSAAEGSCQRAAHTSTEELLARCQRAIAEAEDRYRRCSSNSNGGSSSSSSSSSGSSSSSSSSSSSGSSGSRTGGVVNAAQKGQFNTTVSANGNGQSTDHQGGKTASDRWKRSRRFFGKSPPSPTDEDAESSSQSGNSHGLIILLQVVTSCFRHLSQPRYRIVSIMLLVRMGLCAGASDASDDCEAVLKRILPTLLLALTDVSAGIRALAVRALCAVLCAARHQTVSALEADVFPQYVFPALNAIARDGETVVRVAFAEGLGTIAETARLFLDRAHLMALQRAVAVGAAAASAAASRAGARSKERDEGPMAVPETSTGAGDDAAAGVSNLELNVDFPYDAKLKALHEQVSRWIRDVSSATSATHASVAFQSPTTAPATTEASSASLIRRALLCDIHRLCIFFGQEATTDLLLTQVLTFLNDQDWELRLAFCQKIPTVCAFLGSTVTSECILPFVENALVDVEERVVEEALHCIFSLVQMSLLTRLMTVDAVRSAAPLLLHPAAAIRVAARSLVMSAATALGQTDATVFLLPLIRPALLWDLTGCLLTAEVLHQGLSGPISRKAYQRALLERRVNANNVLKSSEDSAVDMSFQSSSESSEGTIDVGKNSPNSKGGAAAGLTPSRSSPGDDSTGGLGERSNSGQWRATQPSTDSFDFDNDGALSEAAPTLFDHPPTAQSSHTPQRAHDAVDDKRNEQTSNTSPQRQAAISTPSEDADEPLKLLFMKGYLDQAARELAFRGNPASAECSNESGDSLDLDWVTDILRQHETDLGGSATSALLWNMLSAGSQPRGLNSALTRQLSKVGSSAGSSGLSDHAIQCLLVPNQGSYCTGGAKTAAVVAGGALASGVGGAAGLAFLHEGDRRFAKAVTQGAQQRPVGGRAATTVRVVDDDEGTDAEPALGSAVDVAVVGSKEDVKLRGKVAPGDTLNCYLDSNGFSPTVQPALTAATTAASPAPTDSDAKAPLPTATTEQLAVPASQIQLMFGIMPVHGGAESLVGGGGGRVRQRSSSVSNNDGGLGDCDDAWPTKDPATASVLTATAAARRAVRTLGSNAGDGTQLSQRIRALGIPPLPPDLGYLSSAFAALSAVQHDASDGSGSSLPSGASSAQQHLLQQGHSNAVGARPFWATREGTLCTCLREHTGAVRRLAVAPDQLYFASGSADKTIKIWQVRGLDKAAFPRSSVTYTGHKGGVVDLAVIEDSRSVVSCSDDGEMHVWRVDYDSAGMRGLTTVRRLHPDDGPLVAVGHFTGEVASVVTYCSQKGGVGGWDLRAATAAFRYNVPPEFGFATCMATAVPVPPADSADSFMGGSASVIEQPWVMVGTSRGFVLLWDVRFNVVCRAWRHSTGNAILRLTAGRSMSSPGSSGTAAGSAGDGDSGSAGTAGSGGLSGGTGVGAGAGGGGATVFGGMGLGFESFGGISNQSSPVGAGASLVSAVPAADSGTGGGGDQGGVGSGVGAGGGVGASAGGDSGNNSFPYLLVATAGDNEVALWHMPIPDGGACLRCFRSLDVASSRVPSSSRTPAPRLVEVPLLRGARGGVGSSSYSISAAVAASLRPSASPLASSSSASVRAFIGQICHTPLGGLHPSASYLLTAGDDRQIRHWDCSSALKCFVFSGIPYAQHKPTFASSFSSGGGEMPSSSGASERTQSSRYTSAATGSPARSNKDGCPDDSSGQGGTLYCYDTTTPSPNTMLQAQVPVREGRGPCQADTGSKGAILDLKIIDYPKKMLISCGRDGDIKLWR